MATVGQWIEGARPRTLPNAIAPVIVGTGAAGWLHSAVWWKAALALVVSLALIVGVNYANDYSDGIRGTDDDRAGPVRLVGAKLATPRSVLTAAVVIASAVLRAAGPSLIAFGIDVALPRAIEDGDWLPAIATTAAFLALSIGGAGLVGWYVVLIARLTQSVMIELRTRIFRHTQRLSLEFHEGYTSGRIISRQTSDLESIQELLSGSLSELIDAILLGTFTLVALFLIDWRSGLVLVGMGVPLGLLMWWFVIESQKGFRATRVVSARLIVQFVETMTGIRAVQAFRRERRNDRSFGQVSEEYRRANLKVINLFGVLDPGLILIGNVTIAVVLLWGALRVSGGGIEIGVLLAAVLYVRNFFGPLEDVAMFLNSYQSAVAALEKVQFLRHQFGLDKPFLEQYAAWIGVWPGLTEDHLNYAASQIEAASDLAESLADAAQKQKAGLADEPAAKDPH